MASHGFLDTNAEDHVSAFVTPKANYILPIFFVRVILVLRPRFPGGEENGFRVRGPGKCVHFLFAGRDRKGFAAIGRNQIQLRNFFPFVVSLSVFPGSDLSLGDKCDPLAVGRPLRRTVMAGLRQLDQRAASAVNSVKPQFGTEDLLVPVGFVGFEGNRVAVWRYSHRIETD